MTGIMSAPLTICSQGQMSRLLETRQTQQVDIIGLHLSSTEWPLTADKTWAIRHFIQQNIAIRKILKICDRYPHASSNHLFLERGTPYQCIYVSMLDSGIWKTEHQHDFAFETPRCSCLIVVCEYTSKRCIFIYTKLICHFINSCVRQNTDMNMHLKLQNQWWQLIWV